MRRQNRLRIDWALVGIVATWRIASVFYRDGITAPLRHRFGVDVVDEETTTPWVTMYKTPESFIGRLLDCFWCLSVWAGGISLLLYIIFPPLLLIPAWSAVAMWIDEWLSNEDVV